MRKGYSLLFGLMCVFIAAVILILFPAASALAIALLSLIAGFLLAAGYFYKQTRVSQVLNEESEVAVSDRESNEEFASGALLEATIMDC